MSPTTSSTSQPRSACSRAFSASVAFARALDRLVERLGRRLWLAIGVELRIVACIAFSSVSMCHMTARFRQAEVTRWCVGRTEQVVEILQTTGKLAIGSTELECSRLMVVKRVYL